MKDIKKLVLTGGPCGGKTTALSKLDETLTAIGYNAIFVPETATEVLPTGITKLEGISNLDIQKCMIDFQLFKENYYKQLAEKCCGTKSVLICDRGAMDNKAYMDDEDFRRLLENCDITEVKLRDNYDAVFHLCSAAVGAEQFYTLENNTARTETPEQARELDARLINAWTGNPHLRIIGNDSTFANKLKELKTEVLSFLGEPIPLEIERKFLIKMPNWKLLSSFKKINILQTYLVSDNNEEIRIRQRGVNGSHVYFYTKKRPTKISGQRIETEKIISREEYLELLLKANTSLRQIRKDRYCFVHNNLYYELDVYPFWSDHAILEIELTSSNQNFSIPSCFECVLDVTDDPDFKNYNLAINVPKI